MTLFTRVRLTLLIAATVAAVTFVGAQQSAIPEAVQKATLDQTVPVDPLITVGTLPNGLRYYVRANGQPQDRAELRLVVNAGSVLEDDDQRGLAHFVEHMSFNGTLHFPRQELGNFMQSLGMRFGAHVNAYTSFDETVYALQIPTTDAAVIDRSLLILEDWARDVSFDPVEIDKERGVILEEWRLGLGAAERIQNEQFPILLRGSRYAERLPIGRPDIIQNVSHDRLKQFYEDWYRPDLMAVIAVGDFDKSVIEAAIRTHFGSIPEASSPKPRPAYAVPDHPGTLYSVITDPEATNTSISVSSKMTVRPLATVGEYRQVMVERLFSAMLSARLDEIRAGAECAVSLGPNRSWAPGTCRRGDEPGCLGREERCRTGPGGALIRGGPRRSFRLHRDGVGTREAEFSAGASAGRHRERQEPVRTAGRRVRAQLHPGGTNPGHRVRIRV